MNWHRVPLDCDENGVLTIIFFVVESKLELALLMKLKNLSSNPSGCTCVLFERFIPLIIMAGRTINRATLNYSNRKSNSFLFSNQLNITKHALCFIGAVT